MTEPHRAVIARVSADFAAISQYMARVSADLATLDRMFSEQSQVTPAAQPVQPPVQPVQQPQPYPMSYWPQYQPQPQYQRGYQPQYQPQQPIPVSPAGAQKPPRDEGWVGKLLAIAGVAVTLIGVALLLVLAAQAGILRPEIRVAGGAALAAALVGVGVWLYRRPGGRVGAIALAATGIATAYIDVIAITAIYDWVSAPVGLVAAAVIGGGGLTLARRWDSQQLGVLVLVPLIVLAPVVAGGVTLLLVGFMLALAAASLPVQLGKDWIWLHCSRIAAATLPLLIALLALYFDDRRDAWLVAACAIAAGLAIVAALILLRRTSNRILMSLVTGAGVLPLLCVRLVADRAVAALMAVVLAAVLLAIVLIGGRLPGVDKVVRQVWAALSAVSATIAVSVAFDGRIAGPVLLAMAIVVAVAARHEAIARWVALGLAVVGAAFYLGYAPPSSLAFATETTTATAVSTLIGSLLLIAFAAVIVWTTDQRDSLLWAGSAVVAVYAITSFTVTAGVLIGGEERGFFAGHMAATICWIVAAAALLIYAARIPRANRSLPIGGGLALVGAAMAKLFLFDLGTLDGIFRVVVFMVVGLILLGLGAGYARLLEKQDQQQDQQV
ncbi:hypothetical protein BST36_14285 [Mycolicibacterium moriokaense]|uniref:DUF2339 domain-containing protein n=1 Tax=Mycolicibacterium moriokaense TaxID=39691 RepID=A0AAD1M5Z4_9MYCO|nr:DUF2339 domain-containing protein [Mycolicibacterium moriokaense]MCV7038639.1 DUF2339 domain-containing protein [Mycolicibacterium moriokaense]ORB22571.1 hypothetical protein BST36_14285 [Mycolicibacterium moriokaense]BBX02162.1 hypothetical protein MMOR_30980 [Mycolicibacterium moriokaense]